MTRRVVYFTLFATATLLVAAQPGVASAATPGTSVKAVAPAKPDAAPSWTVQTTPKKLKAPGEATAISCATPLSCVAVGDYQSIAGIEVPLAESWNGATWTVDTTPTDLVHFENVAADLAFTGVSCTSTNSCEAVGWSDYTFGNPQPNFTLAASWNGSTWALQQTPNFADPTNGENDLTSVSCVDSALCTAVGWTVSPETGDPNPATMAELWNGTTWTIEPTPTLTGTSQLNSVSCTSATECVAVGSLNGSPLAETFNGSVWTVETTPVPTGATSSSLSGVSCSGGSCNAVGSYSTATATSSFAENWDGTNWTLETVSEPAGAAASALSGISCALPDTCTAVGQFDLGTGPVTLAEGWNGTTWTVEPSPDPSVSQASSLAGVSCIAAPNCQAVGTATSDGVSEPIEESSPESTWRQGDIRDPGFEAESLAGIACGPGTDCQAVGSFAGQNLAEGWSGAQWGLEPTQIQWADGHIQVPSALYSVSCPSVQMCVGAGETWTYSPENGLVGGFPDVATWNGTSWTNQILLLSDVGKMTGVSCTTTLRCIAVGFSPQLRGAVIEGWNGSRWKMQVPAVPTGGTMAKLESVSCVSTTCTAVGSYITSSGATATLVDSHDGKSWIVQPSPSPTGAVSSTLKGISCTSASACTAVGSYKGSNGVSTAFAESWNGTAWTLETIPPLTGWSSLDGISCTSVSGTSVSGTSVSGCTAVGSHAGSALVESWNGTSWALQAPTIPYGATSSSLSGVSCWNKANGPACTAVGTFTDSQGIQETLAESTSNSSPYVRQQPWNEFVNTLGRAMFTSVAAGTPVPTVEWQVSTDNGSTWTPLTDGVQPDGSVVTGSRTGTLDVTSVQPDENGNEYEAVFSSSAGSATSGPGTLDIS